MGATGLSSGHHQRNRQRLSSSRGEIAIDHQRDGMQPHPPEAGGHRPSAHHFGRPVHIWRAHRDPQGENPSRSKAEPLPDGTVDPSGIRVRAISNPENRPG